MSGINALSDTLKVGSKLEKTPTAKGKDVSDSPNNAATAFAAVLSGSMNQSVDSKGQNSKAGQDSKEKQTDDSVQSTQNLDGQASMLGNGNFALSNLIQSMLQSNLPAGKEANSGNDVSQGTAGSANANTPLTSASGVVENTLQLALLSLVSLAPNETYAQSGMTTPNPQGDNPAVTELAKDRQVIADLLVALSGEITDKSPKGTTLGSVGFGTKDLSQEMAKLVQGWMTVTEDGTNNGDPALNAKVATLLADLNPKLSQGSVGGKALQSVNGIPEGENSIINSAIKGSAEALLKGTDLNPVATQVKNTALLTNVQQKLEGVSTQKGDSIQSTQPSVVKDVQTQNSSVGIGLANNIVAANVADGKTTAVPVWEQISTVIREQVMNRSQDLRQLDIQLHPVDLGKIQIDLRWENGQVHLQVQASQAATGQLLQNHLSDLRQALSNQGVNCGMLQMGQGGERQQNPHGDQSRRTSNQNTQPAQDEDLIPVVSPGYLGQDEINLINVMA